MLNNARRSKPAMNLRVTSHSLSVSTQKFNVFKIAQESHKNCTRTFTERQLPNGAGERRDPGEFGKISHEVPNERFPLQTLNSKDAATPNRKRNEFKRKRDRCRFRRSRSRRFIRSRISLKNRSAQIIVTGRRVLATLQLDLPRYLPRSLARYYLFWCVLQRVTGIGSRFLDHQANGQFGHSKSVESLKSVKSVRRSQWSQWNQFAEARLHVRNARYSNAISVPILAWYQSNDFGK